MRVKFLFATLLITLCAQSLMVYASSQNVSFLESAKDTVRCLGKDFWIRFYHEPINLVIHSCDKVSCFGTTMPKGIVKKISFRDIIANCLHISKDVAKGCISPFVYLPLKNMFFALCKWLHSDEDDERLESRTLPVDERIAQMAGHIGLDPQYLRLRVSDDWSATQRVYGELDIVSVDKDEYENNKISEQEKIAVIGHELAHIKNKYKMFMLRLCNPVAIHAGCSVAGAVLDKCLNIIERKTHGVAKLLIQKIRYSVHNVTSSLILRYLISFVFNPETYDEIMADKQSVKVFNCSQGRLERSIRFMLQDKVYKRIFWTKRLESLKKNWWSEYSLEENYKNIRGLMRYKINRLRTLLFDCHPSYAHRARYISEKEQFVRFNATFKQKWHEIKQVIDGYSVGWENIKKLIDAPINVNFTN